MNNRRKLVVALGAGALVAPFGSFAQQQGKVWRVGFLSQRNRPASLESDNNYGAFLRRMRELGYLEGRNLAMEWRFAEGKLDRLSDLAAELVQLKMDVILSGSATTTIALKKATTAIPIVMTGTSDPVGSGLVKSLAHPGGNITGLSLMMIDLGPKFLELLLRAAPGLTRVALLMNPDNPTHATVLKEVRVAAQKTGVKALLSMEARNPQEIENAFSAMARQSAAAFIVLPSPLFNQQHRLIADLAAKNRLPSMTPESIFAESGCLMSYGMSLADTFRGAATYVDKIFKGAKPADLPVEQPTKFELFINGKTAKILNLKIPQSLLVMADKVIE